MSGCTMTCQYIVLYNQPPLGRGVYCGSCDHHDTQAEVYAELGEVAAGTKKLPPFNEKEKFTVFKSLGKIFLYKMCEMKLCTVNPHLTEPHCVSSNDESVQITELFR